MSHWMQHARRGSAVIASFAIAMALLLVGPASTALALALSNNLVTTISLNTNAATGSNTFSTVTPITVTCGVVDITAGAANGVSGVTLTLSAGWTFLGGVAPTVGYAWGGGPTGDATGTIASATSITVAILASCDPGDVITLTRVQVKPATSASGNATITADINTADVTAASITATAAAPTVTAIAPVRGVLDGGTAVTITGTGFVAGATVTVGGIAATSVAFVGATSITAVTPAGAAGAASVVVTNPDTQANAANALYTYAAPLAPPVEEFPTVTAITPTNGELNGGRTVTITGTGFVAGATVTIGGTAATSVVVSETSIIAVTPAGAAGTASVMVRNPDNRANTANTLFTYPATPVPAPVVIVPVATAQPVAAPAAKSLTFTGGTIAPTGTSIVSFTGTPMQLDAVGAANVPKITSVSATAGGKLVTYVIGAPSFVNVEFNAAFPMGLDATMVIVKMG